jgi:hypothetical protein
MPLTRNSLTLALTIAAVAAVGCDKLVSQDISGTLVLADGRGANLPLRLYESFEACEGRFVSGQTDGSGNFQFRTTTTLGGISVVTQSIALCTEREGKWAPLWSTITGGGAPNITLRCAPPKSTEDEFCDMKIDYSGSAA